MVNGGVYAAPTQEGVALPHAHLCPRLPTHSGTFVLTTCMTLGKSFPLSGS